MNGRSGSNREREIFAGVPIRVQRRLEAPASEKKIPSILAKHTETIFPNVLSTAEMMLSDGTLPPDAVMSILRKNRVPNQSLKLIDPDSCRFDPSQLTRALRDLNI